MTALRVPDVRRYRTTHVDHPLMAHKLAVVRSTSLVLVEVASFVVRVHEDDEGKDNYRGDHRECHRDPCVMSKRGSRPSPSRIGGLALRFAHGRVVGSSGAA